MIGHNVSKTTDLGKAIWDLSTPLQVPSIAVLVVSGTVTSGQTVTVGDKIFEFITFTDSGVNTSGGDLDNKTNPVELTFATHERTVGEILKVEDEFLKVLKVIDANTLLVSRGEFGSEIEEHGDSEDILENATKPTAGRLHIPLTDATTAADVVADAITAIQSHTYKYGPLGFGVVNGGTRLIFERDPDLPVLAVSETMSNGAFVHGAAFVPGIRSAESKFSAVSRVMETGETTPVFLFNFDVNEAIVQVRAANGTPKAYDGAVSISGRVVSMDASGDVDIAATDVVSVIAVG